MAVATAGGLRYCRRMANAYRLEIDPALGQRLQTAAEQAGVTPAEFAADILDSALAEDWAVTLGRLERYDQDGVAYDLAPVLDKEGARTLFVIE